MRAWRSPRGFVVDCGPSPQTAVSGQIDELPEGPWRGLRDYVLIDPQGNIQERFEVMTWSIEEELGISVFAVVEGALRNLRVSVFYSDPVRVTREEKTVVSGLHEVTDDDEQARRFVCDSLARRHQTLAEQMECKKRELDALIAAIPGAGDEHGVGDNFRRAQELLCSRVTETLEAAMLRALARFGILHRSLRAPASSGEAARTVLSAALDSFVIACRLLTFDRSLEKQDAAPPPLPQYVGAFAALSETNQADIRDLKEMLGALERDVLQHAEWQEWSDALLNAAQMRRAAAHVGRARETLEKGQRANPSESP